MADLRRIIDESGAHAAVERRIEDLTTESLAALDAAAVAPASRGVLRELAAAATQRTL